MLHFKYTRNYKSSLTKVCNILYLWEKLKLKTLVYQFEPYDYKIVFLISLAALATVTFSIHFIMSSVLIVLPRNKESKLKAIQIFNQLI